METKDVYFGIDYTELSNMKIKKVWDVNKLRDNSNVLIISKQDIVEKEVLTSEKDGKVDQIYYNTIVIEDEEVKVLMGNKMVKKNKEDNNKILIQYIKMMISQKDNSMGNIIPENIKKNKCNLLPISSKEYKEKLDRIIEKLKKEYGIEFSYDKAVFSKLEINKTFLLDMNKFRFYEDTALRLLSYGKPKRYKMLQSDKSDIEGGSIEFANISNKEIKLNIYDKTNNIKKAGITIKEVYMRVELQLLTTRKIKRLLEGHIKRHMKYSDLSKEIVNTEIEVMVKEGLLVKNLIEGDTLRKIYEHEVIKLLVRPYEKHIDNVDKILKNISEEEYAKDSRKWAKIFMYRALEKQETDKKVRLVSDVEQIYKYIKMKSPKNYSKTKKRLEKYINEEFENRKNNLVYAQEVIAKILL